MVRSDPAAGPEAVPHRTHGLDQVGVLLAELGAETPHVDINRAGTAVVVIAPDPAQQGLPGEHLARVRGEELQELVLHVSEVERLALDERADELREIANAGLPSGLEALLTGAEGFAVDIAAARWLARRLAAAPGRFRALARGLRLWLRELWRRRRQEGRRQGEAGQRKAAGRDRQLRRTREALGRELITA